MGQVASTIRGSVGRFHNGKKECFNFPDDQATIQGLLDLIPDRLGGTADETDTWPDIQHRIVSDVLFQAILNFQKKNQGRGLFVDGHIDPDGQAIKLLKALSSQTNPPEKISLPVLVPGMKIVLGQGNEAVCWACSFTMMKIWRENRLMSVVDALTPMGGHFLHKFRLGLGLGFNEEDVLGNHAGMLHASESPMHELVVGEAPGTQAGLPNPFDLAHRLKVHGLLWVATQRIIAGTMFGGHVRVIEGIKGDGSADGTFLQVMDPTSADGTGQRYDEKFSDFLLEYDLGFTVHRKFFGTAPFFQIRYFP